jgi:hypothetical protein
LEQSIQANNIIFETLNLDAGMGGRKRRRYTVKTKIKKQRKTIKKQRHITMKRLKRKGSKRKTK